MKDPASEDDLRPPEHVWVLSHSRHYLVAQFSDRLVFSHRFDRRRDAAAAADRLLAGEPPARRPQASVRWHDIHDLTVDLDRKVLILSLADRQLLIEAQGMARVGQLPMLRSIGRTVVDRCGFIRHEPDHEVLPRYCRPGDRPRRFSSEAPPQVSRSIRGFGVAARYGAAMAQLGVMVFFLARTGGSSGFVPASWLLGLFALFGLGLAVEMVPCLRIDENGLDIRGLITRRRVAWADVEALVVRPRPSPNSATPRVHVVTATKTLRVRATICVRRRDADRIAAVLARLADAWSIPCHVHAYDLVGTSAGLAIKPGGRAFDWLSTRRESPRPAGPETASATVNRASEPA